MTLLAKDDRSALRWSRNRYRVLKGEGDVPAGHSNNMLQTKKNQAVNEPPDFGG